MFNFETQDEYEKRMKRRADILFPNTVEKKKEKEIKPKNLPLGKSIYDDLNDIANGKVEVKSELDALDEMDKPKKNSDVKLKSRKERTPDEQEEFLNEFYPSMKHLGRDKVNQTDDEKSEKDKKGNFTGGAADVNRAESILKENKKSNNYKNIDNTVFSDNAWKKTRILIQGSEKFEPKAYKPTKNDVWTIGYGHTKGVKEGDTITKEQAEELYKKDFVEYSQILKKVKVSLNDNEKAALTSFAYNVGTGAFSGSTLLKKLNKGDKQGAANEFDKWIYQNGQKLNGLVERRKKEKELFLTPDE